MNMNRSKKLRTVFITLIMIIGLLSSSVLAESWTCTSCKSVSTGNFCSNCGEKRSSNSSAASSGQSSLDIVIDFEQNMFFSTYDVKLLLDEEQIATMKHGKGYTYTTFVNDGTHHLKFINKNDSSVFGDVYFTVNGKTLYSCMIHCKHDGVEIDNIQVNGSVPDTRIRRGESGSVKSITVNFDNYKESKGSNYNTPSNGKVFVIFDLEMLNQSSSEINVSTMLSFNAYCDDYALESSFSAILACDNPIDVTIAPGKKAKGQIGFEVPKNWNTIEVEFTPSLWSSDKLVFVATK